MKRKCKTAWETAIVNGHLYFEDVIQCHMSDDVFTETIEHNSLNAIRLVSLSTDWELRVWLDAHTNIVEKVNFEMTLRKEQRGQNYHWYAYRRVMGRLHKRYVGTSEQITESRLLEIARKMPSL